MSSFFVRKPVRKKKPPFGSEAPVDESHTARFKVHCEDGFVRGKPLFLTAEHLEQGIAEAEENIRFMTFISGQYLFSFLCGMFSSVYQRTSIHIMVNNEPRGMLDLPFDMRHKYAVTMDEPYKAESYVHMSAGDSFWFAQDVASDLGASSGVFLVEPEIHVDVLRVTSF